ncbi:G2-specific serine/threonine protein kinase [Dissophora globulifera]|nr:G2-specific serine/threonine protein kinase [Dissophora globulifera]
MHHDARQMDGYEALESIGSGSFGLIRKVRRKADGKILARKEIDYRKMSTKEKEQLVAEVNILKDLKHPNIVEFLERVIDRENSFIYILMEYCEGGDLAAVIRRHKEKSVPIPEEFVWSIMTQLVLALHECHCGMIVNEDNQPAPRHILHRDLKPDNVFLDAKKNVKLGDFGLSRSLTNPQKAFAQTYVGELITDSLYDAKSDIWSLGCVVYEMCALEPPFLAETQSELSAKIKLGRIQMLPAQYSQELNMVVRAMLQVNPRRRPTTGELLSNSRIRYTSVQLKKAVDMNEREERLGEKERIIKDREGKVAEREAFLATIERKFQAESQMLKEREGALNSREEAIRSTEASLNEWQKKLSWEQQHLDDRRRELLQEQERRQSMARKATSSKQSDAMAIDNSGLQDISSGKSGASSITNGTSQSSSHPAATTTGSSLERYLAARGIDTTSDLTLSRTVPRRKTALSAGRYSLQTPSAFRSVGTASGNNSAGGGGVSSQPLAPSTEALDLGGTYASNYVANNASVNQSSRAPTGSGSPSDSTLAAPKAFQTQPYTYQSSGGKESRLSGRLSQLPALSAGGSTTPTMATSDSQRLRGKSKSASTLIASMSSTTLSNMTSAPSSSSFQVPEPMKPASSTTISGAASSTTASNQFLTSNYNFTPTLPSTSFSAPNDIQMSDSVETSSQQQNTLSNGSSIARPTSTPVITSSRGLGFHPQTHTSSASSSALSSGTNVYPSRRPFAPGLVPSMGHIRFNPASGSGSSANGQAAVTTAGTSMAAHNAAANSAAVVDSTATPLSVSTTPSKPQGGMQLIDERSQRNGTPERSARQEDIDLRMEWDDDIPSPFIKKSYSRFPLSNLGGAPPSRNHLGS